MDQREIWDKRHEKTNMPAIAAEDIWIKKYEKYFDEKRDKTIIDLGCGSGINSFYLYDNGYDVIACDFSPAAIEKINIQNPKINALRFDMREGIPVRNKNVGIVLSSLSAHYFTLSETKTLFERIHDLLDVSGYFIFRVNSVNEYVYNNKGDVIECLEENYYRLKDGSVKRYFDVETLRRLLNAFKIIEINESCFSYWGRKKYFIDVIAQK